MRQQGMITFGLLLLAFLLWAVPKLSVAGQVMVEDHREFILSAKKREIAGKIGAKEVEARHPHHFDYWGNKWPQYKEAGWSLTARTATESGLDFTELGVRIATSTQNRRR